jgi:hypothetical protein
LHYLFVDAVDNIIAECMAEIDKQKGIKRFFRYETRIAKKVLKVNVFRYLCDCFTIIKV